MTVYQTKNKAQEFWSARQKNYELHKYLVIKENREEKFREGRQKESGQGTEVNVKLRRDVPSSESQSC